MMANLAWRRSRHRRYARQVREQIGAGGLSLHANDRWWQDVLELPSADRFLHFNAHITLWASWGSAEPKPPNLFDIAKHGIAERADPISTRHRLTGSNRLKEELNTVLLQWEEVQGTPVQAAAQCESIDADSDLVEAVSEHETAQRRQLMSSWQEQECNRRHEQMCALLLDPLRATAWWLLDNTDKTTEVLPIARNFRELRDLLSPEEQPGADTVGGLLDDLLSSTAPPNRELLVDELSTTFATYERKDLVERLASLRSEKG